MKKNILICLSVFITSCILFSCQKQVGTFDANAGKDYFPLTTGHSVTYKVDSTYYDDFTGTIYSRQCFFKDVIDTPFLDLKNNVNYFVNRYYKTDSMADYILLTQYYVTPYNNRIEMVYDNLRYVKMIFPVTYLSSWGGNDYINDKNNEPYSWLGVKPYSYQKIGVPYSTDSLSFNNTVTVFQRDELIADTVAANTTTYGEYNYAIEKYAQNIGLIDKEIFTLYKDQVGSKGKLRGFKTKMQCIAFN